MHVLGICAQNDLIDGDMRNLFFFFQDLEKKALEKAGIGHCVQ